MSQLKQSTKILLVDDDPDILELLEYNLAKENYVLAKAVNGQQALEIAKTFKPNLVILDVMMPILDGIETARQMKLMPELKSSIILFLTARGEEYTEIAAFEAGGADYVVKPIKPRALVSRIKSMLNREGGPAENSQEIIQIGDLVINRTQYSASFQGRLLVLPKKEFELLSLLASKPGKVFTREQILESIWGDDVLVVDRTIDVHIRKIREKLDDNFIQTIKGVGYKFEV